jgi:hypothetical protein
MTFTEELNTGEALKGRASSIAADRVGPNVAQTCSNAPAVLASNSMR